MAFFHMNCFSPALKRNIDADIIVPSPTSEDLTSPEAMDFFYPGVKFPVVYLLHGAFGDHSDWHRFSKAEVYAQERKLILVMPSGENSFYVDIAHGGKYFTYLSQELPTYIRTFFPVSDKKEDTFIVGLSMGGYGAVHTAFACPEQYAAAASLSGVLDIVHTNIPFDRADIFGDPSKIEGSDADIFALAHKQRENGHNLPPVYHTIGTEDDLCPLTSNIVERAKDAGFDVTYVEHPGKHDWYFWDTYLPEVLDWLLSVRSNGTKTPKI